MYGGLPNWPMKVSSGLCLGASHLKRVDIGNRLGGRADLSGSMYVSWLWAGKGRT
jgi:hypothetical protein